MINSEQAQLVKRQELSEKKGGNINKKKANWKAKSEEFRAAMKVGQMIKSGKIDVKSIPITSSSSIYSDYVHCKYCNRRYNEQAYNKHINHCMSKAKDSLLRPKMNTNMKQTGGINKYKI